MSEASQNRQILINDFAPGWILKRGSAYIPNGPLILHNAYVNDDNSIIARGGLQRINSTPLTDGGSSAGSRAVHSTILHGGVRYVGVGTVIKRGIDPGVNIITGLNIRRCTMASMSPSTASHELWTYFANGNFTTHGAASGDCRKKDNGTLTRNWGIEGPSTAPTVALSANLPASVAIDTFASAYTAIDTGTEGVADDPYSTSARSFEVTSGNTCRFRKTGLSLNLSSFAEEGYIRLMVRLSRISDVQLLGLAFDVGDGSFTNDYYHISTRQVGFSTDNIWEELLIRKGDFVRVKQSAGSTNDWSDVVAIQFTVSGAGDIANPFVFSADDMRLEAATHADGVVDYRATWWNDDLKIRSNSRSLSDVYNVIDRTSPSINIKRQGITVGRPGTTSDPQVTHWEIWRRNTKLAGIFQFVDRTPISNSTYLDTKSEEELGEALIDDNHIPPPGDYIVSFNDQMFVLGMKTQTIGGVETGEEQSEYTVRFSARFRPESFPLTNYFLCGNPVDTIRGYTVWDNQLWIFTKKHIFRVVPVGDSYTVQETEAPVGTESPYSISPSPFGIFYYVPGDGPYVFNGSTSVPIASEQIQAFFDGEVFTVDGINIPVATPRTISDHNNILGQYHNRNYWLVVDDSTGTCRTMVYNADRKRWWRCGGRDFTFQRMSSEKAGDNTFPANNLEAGNVEGWLLTIDPVFNRTEDPGGEAIEVIIQHTFDTLMKPSDIEVDIKDIIIDADTGGQSALVECSFDDQPLEVITAGSALRRGKIFMPVPGITGERAEGRICYKCSVRFTLKQRTFRMSLFGLGLQYWPEPRRSESYSSMWFAAKERAWVRRGRLVIRSYAPVRGEVIFDEGRSFVINLPNTQGKRLGFNPTFITGIHGKVARVVFVSDEPFCLYPQSYFEMYPFGEGSQLIPWQVQP